MNIVEHRSTSTLSKQQIDINVAFRWAFESRATGTLFLSPPRKGRLDLIQISFQSKVCGFIFEDTAKSEKVF